MGIEACFGPSSLKGHSVSEQAAIKYIPLLTGPLHYVANCIHCIQRLFTEHSSHVVNEKSLL